MYSQAPKLTPKKDDLIGNNLYEIPSCTICLQELVEDMVCLACGHCFHYLCITQHFQYRGTCPNCQKRAGSNQLRPVLYRVTHNTNANARLMALVSSLNISQRKQVQQLLREVKAESEKVQKFRGRMQQTEKDLKKQQQLNANLRYENNKLNIQLVALKKQKGQLEKYDQSLRRQLMESQRHLATLRLELENYQKQEKQFTEFKRFKNIMNENSKEIVNYKHQLENKHTAPEEMCKLFFDMLMLKNLDFLKAKEKLGQYPHMIFEKDNQIAKLRSNLDSLKKDLREANQKKSAERKKYQELKVKFRQICEKAKLKGVSQVPEVDESSQGFNTLSKSQVSQPKLQSQFAPIFKKPSFTLGSSFGGLKKKA